MNTKFENGGYQMKEVFGENTKHNVKTNGIFAPLFFASTLGIFGPLVLYITNINEFWFSIADIWWIAALGGLVLFTLCFGISLVFKGKGKEIYICIIFGLALGFYIQGNFINVDYGVLDGESIDWNSYTGVAIANTIVWLICTASPFILRHFLPKYFKQVIRSISIFVILIQVITLGVLFLTTDFSHNNTDTYITTEGEFDLSENKNIVIFVLDAFDSSLFKELIEEYPKLKEETFKDFTYFPDTVGGATRTTAALPVILTGQAWTKAVSYHEYLKSAYSEAKLYDVLDDYDYDTRIFANSSFVPSSQIGRVGNLTKGHGIISSYRLLTKHLYQLTMFSYMPHLLKSKFWFYSGVFDDIHSGSEAESYKVSGVEYYQRLVKEKISANKSSNAFRLYHLIGAHPPFTMNEYAKEVSLGETTQLQQIRGSLHIIEEYINQLKEAGIYDKTTLIVMADHGCINYEQNPLFMIKTFDSNNDFQMNYAPLSYFDLHATLISIITGDKESYGNTIFNIEEGDNRIRLFYKLSSSNGITITEYKINGHAWDKEAVSATGNVYYGNTHLYTCDYKLGTKLTFGSTGNAAEYLINGFSSGSAGGHTWTNGTKAKIKLVLTKKPKLDLVVKANCIGYNECGGQRMIVSVGGTIVHNWIYSGNSTIEFSVPNELIDGKTLVLDFEFPDAVSPKSLFGVGYDPRDLAFAFTSLCVDEGAIENKTNMQKYTLGDEIIFTADYDGTKYFQYGIGKVNKNYAWSSGRYGHFFMDIGDEKRPLLCTIKLTAVYNDTQHVIIKSNGQILYDDTITKNNKEISFKVPSNCIADGILALSFEYPDAMSPYQQGTGTDKRLLSIAFNKIVFNAAEEAEALFFTDGIVAINFGENGDGEKYITDITQWNKQESGHRRSKAYAKLEFIMDNS